MSKVQFIVKGEKATVEEMAEVTKLRLAGNFVRVIRDDKDVTWPGWETKSLKPKRGRKPKDQEPADLIGNIDDD